MSQGIEIFTLAMPHQEFVEFDKAVQQVHGAPLEELAVRDPAQAFELVVEKAFEIGNVNGVGLSEATQAADPNGRGMVSQELQRRLPNPNLHFVWVEVQQWQEDAPTRRLLRSRTGVSQRAVGFLVKPPS